jgi:acid-sensing ion channel, other
LEFPTVTVCPVNPSDEEKINETAYRTIASYDPSYYEFIPLLRILPNLTYDNIDIAYKLYKEALKIDSNVEKSFQKSTLREMVFKLAMKCEDLFSICTYRGESVPCCDFFEQLYSERGFCFSFNPRYIGVSDEE